MALINLQPKYAELQISQSHEGSSTHSISLNVEPKQGGGLGLQNWISLRNVSWTVRLFVPQITERQAEGSIGTFSYVKEYCSPDSEIYLPEACHIHLEVDSEAFELLISTIQSGGLPDNISIDVFGLDTEL
ncbi:MAG: hypothetical protein PHE96_02025 [Methylococcales bacterium]|nr:hypothetical protein [Methylococcales bacterium]